MILYLIIITRNKQEHRNTESLRWYVFFPNDPSPIIKSHVSLFMEILLFLSKKVVIDSNTSTWGYSFLYN